MGEGDLDIKSVLIKDAGTGVEVEARPESETPLVSLSANRLRFSLILNKTTNSSHQIRAPIQPNKIMPKPEKNPP